MNFFKKILKLKKFLKYPFSFSERSWLNSPSVNAAPQPSTKIGIMSFDKKPVVVYDDDDYDY